MDKRSDQASGATSDSARGEAWHRQLRTLATPTIELLQTEYPNGLRIDLSSPPDRPITPRTLHPAFYGCYDWHSSVHSHWQVARAARLGADDGFTGAVKAVLNEHLTEANLAIEMEWVTTRPGFEMPYGMAWVLALGAELRSWTDGTDSADGTGGTDGMGSAHSADAARWLRALSPLETHAGAAFERYCATMAKPMRGGLHNQSAFALGLVFDSVAGTAVDPAAEAASDSGHPSGHLVALITETALRLFGEDTDVNLAYEPSASDFLSPALSEADLMRRVMPAEDFGRWLGQFVPDGFDPLAPVTVVDASDGQLAHWAGLNLSRSWMLSAIATSLVDDDRRISTLTQNAERHRDAGLATAGHQDYMISHWVPTFAVYLLTAVH